mmetsp:Transcript_42052/g.68229  ORF Transcript_42052/g.68229 Transcript_42052/m.68229 type:complete len:888 (+) Transcript_42052:121-2784(+)
MRKDKAVLDKIVSTMTSLTEHVRGSVSHRYTLSLVVRTASNLLTHGKPPEDPATDTLATGGHVPTALLSLLKNLLTPPTDPTASETIVDVLDCVGIVAEASFAVSDNGLRAALVPPVYIHSFFPLLARLVAYPHDPNLAVQEKALSCASAVLRQAGATAFSSRIAYTQLLDMRVPAAICSCLDITTTLAADDAKARPPRLAVDRLSHAAIRSLSALVHTGPVASGLHSAPRADVQPFPYVVRDDATVDPNRGSTGLPERPLDSMICGATGDELLQRTFLQKACDLLKSESRPFALQVLLQTCRASVACAESLCSNSTNISSLLSIVSEPDATNTLTQGVTFLLLATLIQHVPSISPRVIDGSILSTEALLSQLRSPTVTSPTNPSCLLAASASAHLLAALLDHESTRSTIAAKVLEPSTLTAIRNMLSFKVSGPSGQVMARLEGTCFGYPQTGFLDGALNLVKKVLQKGGPSVGERLLDSTIWSQLCEELKSLSPTSEVSPASLLAAVKLIYDLISKNIKLHIGLLLKDDLLLSLIALIREARLRRLSQWRCVSVGKGAVAAVVTQVVSVLYIPFANTVEDSLLGSVQQSMYNNHLVRNLVASISYMAPEYCELPIGLLSRLVLGANHFARQFVESSGMTNKILAPFLGEDMSCNLIVDTLLIVSQLARISKDNYEHIHRADLYQQFRRLLGHPEASVRAKTCNLLGNLCRHSAYFYDALLRYDLLGQLIERCTDPDRNTRKFACFAIGNAGFHNDSLYESLRPCIPALISLLTDPEEKTRANAAGALGNLVRNSSMLCTELIRAGAVRQLLETLKDEGSAKKIALFSLGNFCAYEECRELLLNSGFRTTIDQMSSSSDPVVQKYIARIIAKLKNPSSGPVSASEFP